MNWKDWGLSKPRKQNVAAKMTFRKPICGSVSRWGATRASEGRSIFSTLNSKSGIKTHYKGHKGMKLELSSLRWRENREDFFREDLGVQDHRRVRLFSRFQKHWCLDSTSWFRIRIERKHWWGNEHATIRYDQYTLPAGNRRRFTFIALVSFLFIAFSIFQLHFHDNTVRYANRFILLEYPTKNGNFFKCVSEAS